VKKRK
jgi:chromosome segregation ATPase